MRVDQTGTDAGRCHNDGQRAPTCAGAAERAVRHPVARARRRLHRDLALRSVRTFGSGCRSGSCRPEAPVSVTSPPTVGCRQCGNALHPEARYCTRCGSAVAAATAAPRARAGEAPRAGFEAPAPPAAPTGPRWTLSEVFALRALGWLAGVVTLLGIVFLYALAEQRGWVGPGARVGFGVAVSTVLLGAAFVLRARYGDELEALAAAGTAVAGLYVSLFAAVELYHLVPKAAGLPLALAIAGLAVAIAWRWSSEPLAVLGLAGAMIAPPVSEHAVTPFSMVPRDHPGGRCGRPVGQARLAVADRRRDRDLAGPRPSRWSRPPPTSRGRSRSPWTCSRLPRRTGPSTRPRPCCGARGPAAAGGTASPSASRWEAQRSRSQPSGRSSGATSAGSRSSRSPASISRSRPSSGGSEPGRATCCRCTGSRP